MLLCLRSDIVIFGHVNSFLIYLLTYYTIGRNRAHWTMSWQQQLGTDASKSKEMVFRTRSVRGKSCMDIKRVVSHTMHGVVSDRLTVVDHVNSLLSSSASLLYALHVLRCHGTSTSTLRVFRETIVTKITYCATTSPADRTQFDSFLPERDYVTFGSLLSQFRLSVVCLSSVCNVGAPYSGGWTFRQNFFTAVYAGHPLTSVQNFTEIVEGEPLRRGR